MTILPPLDTGLFYSYLRPPQAAERSRSATTGGGGELALLFGQVFEQLVEPRPETRPIDGMHVGSFERQTDLADRERQIADRGVVVRHVKVRVRHVTFRVGCTRN